jgi:hypothetical protein
MNKAVGFLLFLALSPLTSSATKEAVRVPKDMLEDPATLALISEYHTIINNPKLAKVCGDKKNFGIHTIRVDGERVARYFVEGPGVGCLPSRLRPKSPWIVTRFGRGWEENDHGDWQQFVATLGQAVEDKRCSTVDSCMLSSANILRDETDMAAFHYADCADFPYYLRTYFSYKKGLPFSLASYIRPRELSSEDQTKKIEVNLKVQDLLSRVRASNKGALAPFVIPMPPPGNKAALTLAPDINEIPGLSMEEVIELRSLLKTQERNMDPRYAKAGNWVAGRTWVTGREKVDFFNGWVQRLRNSASTATLRIWRNEGESYFDAKTGYEHREHQPDFYSPALNPVGIMPGTVIYKTDGHTAVVYKINPENGDIHYIDAHPDNSVTFGVVDQTWIKGMTGESFLGGGFKNFRPIAYKKGWFGGDTTAYMAEDKQMGYYYSTEQFEKFPDTDSTALYSENGLRVEVGYLDFLRLRMSGGQYRIDPIRQFKTDVASLCGNIQTRRAAVLEATDRGLHLEPHPVTLPSNIFGAQGDWEKFSTPGRDVVFKQRVIALGQSLGKYKKLIQGNSPLLTVNYTVPELKEALKQAWTEAAAACKVTYVNSKLQEVSMNLIQAVQRAPLMDYDPYICPERRFGATSAQELATCADDATKTAWHKSQQFLRNRLEKTPSEAMGWSLKELLAMPNNVVDPGLVRKLDITKTIEAL